MTGTPFKRVSVFILVRERITRRLLVGSGIIYKYRVSWFRFGYWWASQHPLNIIKNKQYCFVDVNTCVGFIKISTRVPFFNWLPVLQITSCYVVSGSFRSQLFTAYRANWMVAKKRKRIFHCIPKKPCLSFLSIYFF